jgi:hypothetical protein
VAPRSKTVFITSLVALRLSFSFSPRFFKEREDEGSSWWGLWREEEERRMTLRGVWPSISRPSSISHNVVMGSEEGESKLVVKRVGKRR